MREQLELNEKYAKTGGEIFYRYRMIAESETVSEFIKAYNGRAEAGAASNDSIAVYLNGKRLAFDTEPIIESGRTLVPLRAIFEGMGAKVDWNAESETVTALKGNTEIRLKIGENVFYKNGKAVSLDVPSRIQDSRTLVPLRAISEAFGADVNWDGAQRTVSIFFN